ncbi:hypothetical protein D4R42_04095 [bacterium]|nr:MAG: hypothetical protein D4R42_04095 [bacterium]
MEDTSQNQKDKECGDSCTINAGVGVALQICKLAGINSEDIKDDLFNEKITVQQAFDNIKERLGEDKFHVGLVEEVEQIMESHLEENHECVSVFVKTQMEKQIDEWIKDREDAVETAPPGKFVEGTTQLIENLKASKNAIDKLPTCEAE